MFGKKKAVPQIDKEQLELIKNAQQRVKQKKRLYIHFVIFLIGAVFLIILNTVLGIGETTKIFGLDWFVFAILAWLFLFIYHLFNVFITHKFMGKDWEETQIQKLVSLQKERIVQLKEEIGSETPATRPTQASEIIKPKMADGLTMIVAAGENDAIGKNNELIWHLSDDLKRFKSLTSGHHMIMGRKTFESFAKPLPNRTHIVITRQPNYQVPEGVIVAHNLQDAIAAAKNDTQPFVIGGGEIYKQAMSLATKIEITRVHESFDADTFFPKINPSIWTETQKVNHPKDDNHEYSFTYITYRRK